MMLSIVKEVGGLKEVGGRGDVVMLLFRLSFTGSCFYQGSGF